MRLKYLRGLLFWEGTLYIDLTGGAQLPEELRAFEELESGGTVAGYPYAYAARYVGGEYVCNVVYIKIDGAEVLSYVDAEMKEHGDALLAPYMTAGSAALYKTSLQAKSFTVNAQNAAVIGNSFVEGGSGAVVSIKPAGFILDDGNGCRYIHAGEDPIDNLIDKTSDLLKSFQRKND